METSNIIGKTAHLTVVKDMDAGEGEIRWYVNGQPAGKKVYRDPVAQCEEKSAGARGWVGWRFRDFRGRAFTIF